MDELDKVINRAGAFEREQEQAGDWSEPESEAKPESAAIASVDPMEAAGNMAESLLRVAEGAIKMFADHRLELDADEIEAGRAGLAPAIDKHGLTAGNGKMPYQEEIQAGFYLGGLWRRFRRALGELRAKDQAKAKAEQERKQANGDQREHGTQEPARPIPSSERVREEPNPDSPGWDSENWGTGSTLGQ